MNERTITPLNDGDNPMTKAEQLRQYAETICASEGSGEGGYIAEAWDDLARASSEFRVFACAFDGFGTSGSKFAKLIDACAYDSAAIMLVPQGCSWSVTNIKDGEYEVMDFTLSSAVVHDGDGIHLCRANAATTALALTAAALRAHACALADKEEK